MSTKALVELWKKNYEIPTDTNEWHRRIGIGPFIRAL